MKKMMFFALLAIGCTLAFTTRTIEINGIVIDADSKEPLIGANIVASKHNGTITDIDGKFTMTVADHATLTVSYTGFETQKVQVKNEKDLVIKMVASSMMLDEVVIVGQANKIQERAMTYSTGTIQGVSKRQKPRRHRAPAPSMAMEYERNFHTEDYDLIQENIFHRPKTNPMSTFSIDVDAASYANLRRMVQAGQSPPIDAIRIEEMINYFEYNYHQPKDGHPFSIHTELGECPWNAKHQLLHIGLQGKQIPTQSLPASNLVFLLDVSGSMNSYNKLPLLKSALKMLTGNLREQDRVSIVVYAGSSGLVLPATSGADKHTIIDALDKLQAGGSTGGAEGIRLAYQVAVNNFIEDGNNRVILATDGDFNVGVSSDAELVRIIEKKRESGVFLTVLGFGTGNYKDNKMQKLAQHGNGQHAYIDNIDEARKVLVTEFGGSMYSIAKDVKLQLEFNPTKINGYRLIGYENRMLETEDFNDDKKDAGEIGAGHTVTAIYEIIPTGVESNFLKPIAQLKYQKEPTSRISNEWVNLKIRYKKPDGRKSQLLEQGVTGSPNVWEDCSEDYKWSASVAAWGMFLRDSEFKGNTDPRKIIQWAKEGRGDDVHGYRHEMIKMVRSTDLLVGN